MTVLTLGDGWEAIDYRVENRIDPSFRRYGKPPGDDGYNDNGNCPT